jgi:hypothetical protein
MTKLSGILIAAVLIGTGVAYAESPHLPPVVVGEWCSPGGGAGWSLYAGGVDAVLYVNCKDDVIGSGCESITVVPNGMGFSADGEVDPCNPRCRVTNTTNTIYGLDATFDCGERLLLNMIAPDRLLITWNWKGEHGALARMKKRAVEQEKEKITNNK